MDAYHEINELFHERGAQFRGLDLHCWIEANFVVAGEGPDLERHIAFLLRDTCTCVLDHLPKAIESAGKPVDPRIAALLNHEYFKQEKRNE